MERQVYSVLEAGRGKRKRGAKKESVECGGGRRIVRRGGEKSTFS
jgi:hypothetical protein